MTQVLWYAAIGVGLLAIGLAGLLLQRHLLRQVLGLNVMSIGVFMLFVALAQRSTPPDPVPHAMVLTGLVVSVSATALALVLLGKVQRRQGRPQLPEDETP